MSAEALSHHPQEASEHRFGLTPDEKKMLGFLSPHIRENPADFKQLALSCFGRDIPQEERETRLSVVLYRLWKKLLRGNSPVVPHMIPAPARPQCFMAPPPPPEIQQFILGSEAQPAESILPSSTIFFPAKPSLVTQAGPPREQPKRPQSIDALDPNDPLRNTLHTLDPEQRLLCFLLRSQGGEVGVPGTVLLAEMRRRMVVVNPFPRIIQTTRERFRASKSPLAIDNRSKPGKPGVFVLTTIREAVPQPIVVPAPTTPQEQGVPLRRFATADAKNSGQAPLPAPKEDERTAALHRAGVDLAYAVVTFLSSNGMESIESMNNNPVGFLINATNNAPYLQPLLRNVNIQNPPQWLRNELVLSIIEPIVRLWHNRRAGKSNKEYRIAEELAIVRREQGLDLKEFLIAACRQLGTTDSVRDGIEKVINQQRSSTAVNTATTVFSARPS